MTTKIDPTPEDPLRALVQDYRNEAEVIHYSREGGFHEEPDWRSCTSIQCARMRAAIEKAEAALAAPPVAGAEADDGRPPLDPATIAHDKAYMAGVVRGRELEREAAALRSAAPALDVERLVMAYHRHGCIQHRKAIHQCPYREAHRKTMRLVAAEYAALEGAQGGD
jgi:hypothetical protein